MSDQWKKRIEQAIEDKGTSMKAVSLAAGKNETFVRDMLVRDRAPSIDNFAAVARALGMTVGELMGDESVPLREPGLRRVEVAAHVQAGHFEETWEWTKATVMRSMFQTCQNIKAYGSTGGNARPFHESALF